MPGLFEIFHKKKKSVFAGNVLSDNNDMRHTVLHLHGKLKRYSTEHMNTKSICQGILFTFYMNFNILKKLVL